MPFSSSLPFPFSFLRAVSCFEIRFTLTPRVFEVDETNRRFADDVVRERRFFRS